MGASTATAFGCCPGKVNVVHNGSRCCCWSSYKNGRRIEQVFNIDVYIVNQPVEDVVAGIAIGIETYFEYAVFSLVGNVDMGSCPVEAAIVGIFAYHFP